MPNASMMESPFSRPATYSRSLRARGTERTDFLFDVDIAPASPLSFQVRYTYDSSLYELVQMRAWPAEGVTRVPYWVYQDEDVYAREQERIYRGATWNFLGLEAELPDSGDFKTTFVGEMPVVVARDLQGALRCFENRCAHRGALLCLASRGNTKEITCIYHNWTYDLEGNLTGVAFRRGVRGQGGMPEDAKPASEAPRKLRV